MSRFWAAGGSDSDSDNSDDDSDNGEEVQQQVRRVWAVDSDTDSDDDQVRVVRSAKDRAFMAMRETCNLIRNKIRINDWSAIQEEFENLNKLYEKHRTIITREGLPPFYVRILVELEDHLQDTLKNREAVKKMSKVNNHSLKRMKLTLRKHNANFEREMEAYRANPILDDDEDDDDASESDESDDSDDDSDESSSTDSDSDDDSDDDDDDDDDDDKAEDSDDSIFGGDSDSDESSSSESEDDRTSGLTGRARWLKRTPETSGKAAADRRRNKQEAQSKKEKIHLADANQQPSFVFDANMNEEELDRKVLEVMGMRGRRQTDVKTMMQKLQALSALARRFGAVREIPVLMHLLSSLFDTQRTIDDYMSSEMWRMSYGYAIRVLDLLAANPELRLGIMGSEDMAELMLASRGELNADSLEALQARLVQGNNLYVSGAVVDICQRLQESYMRSLRGVYPDMTEYRLRVSDEAKLLRVAEKAQQYYTRAGDMSTAARLAQLRIEYLYYRHETMDAAMQHEEVFEATYGNKFMLHPSCIRESADDDIGRDPSLTHPGSWQGKPQVEYERRNLTATMNELCKVTFNYGDDRIKTRTMLCKIIHVAIHNDYHSARDLLLMSHLQDTIQYSEGDVDTQILYNRMMVTLGVCAFRAGLMEEAHYCLSEICCGKSKELLAQGVSKRYTDSETEKAERRRQVPFHMHISQELLDSAHLTSAMLQEVPITALKGKNTMKGYWVSKQLRKYIDFYDGQLFLGPPETNRDHLLAASKALARGEWRTCVKYVTSLDVWNLIPGENATEGLKQMLQMRIKVEGLRTYLFTNSPHYQSVSQKMLAKNFELEENKVHSIVSKMMIEGQIKASWDADTILLHRDEPSKLQSLAALLADKTELLVESNERLLDARTGKGGFKDEMHLGRYPQSSRGFRAAGVQGKFMNQRSGRRAPRTNRDGGRENRSSNYSNQRRQGERAENGSNGSWNKQNGAKR